MESKYDQEKVHDAVLTKQDTRHKLEKQESRHKLEKTKSSKSLTKLNRSDTGITGAGSSRTIGGKKLSNDEEDELDEARDKFAFHGAKSIGDHIFKVDNQDLSIYDRLLLLNGPFLRGGNYRYAYSISWTFTLACWLLVLSWSLNPPS